MENNYTTERNVQMLLALLKAHQIRKVVASPGTANLTFVISLQTNSFFQIYSAPDERSAGYMACGMAAESGEPVVITCTGATASRNYLPALTEAWYRHLPVLAVAGTLGMEFIGQLHPQVLDRTGFPKDTYCYRAFAGKVRDAEDEWICNTALNQALVHLLTRRQPVLIELQTRPASEFGVRNLPATRVIRPYAAGDTLPELPEGRIALFIGAHPEWTEAETAVIDQFCKERGAVIFGDHTANCRGLKGLTPALAAFQNYQHAEDFFQCDLLLHLGYISGDYYTAGKLQPRQVWRINPDGEIRDEFHHLTAVFQMKEADFFRHYLTGGPQKSIDYLTPVHQSLMNRLPDLPFSNLWMASQLGSKLPENSVLHLAILNSLRSANFFQLPESVRVYSNVGGFGIDGCLSTVMGAALASPDKLFYCVTGDLAFFYDMNALGNRHFPKNIRILLVNNGLGAEFTMFTHPAAKFGTAAREYAAAGGHYAAQAPQENTSGDIRKLVEHYVTDLGFAYRRVTTKEEFLLVMKDLLEPAIGEQPLLVEALVRPEDESQALQQLRFIEQPSNKDKVKDAIKDVIGEKAFRNIVKAIK